MIQTNVVDVTLGGLAVSSSDLLQTNLSSISSVGGFANFSNNTLSLLADGSLGTPGSSGGSFAVAPGPSTSITFLLDTTTNSMGYSITGLATYASWDSGRDGQEYTVAYSNVSAPSTFIDLFTISQFTGPGSPFDPQTTSVTLTENSSGILASNVASLRFTFTSFEASGSAYREIDAFGTAESVPEPATFGLSGFAFLCLAVRRYRRIR